jgi:ankyrin repeat protein
MTYAGLMRFFACGLLALLTGCGLGEAVSPLISAARDGNVEQIKRLVAARVDVNEPGGVNHWTPLMHAIHKNQAGAVEALLEAGAQVNVVSGNTTALILAAGYGETDIVRMLLSHGADPKLAVRPGVTALAAAVGGSRDIDNNTAGKCQTDTVKALLERDSSLLIPSDSEAVQTAQKGGCTEVVALVTR